MCNTFWTFQQYCFNTDNSSTLWHYNCDIKSSLHFVSTLDTKYFIQHDVVIFKYLPYVNPKSTANLYFTVFVLNHRSN